MHVDTGDIVHYSQDSQLFYSLKKILNGSHDII